MSRKNEYRAGRHCVFKLHCHLVFVTKYRYDVFKDYMFPTLEKLFKKVCKDFETELVEVNGKEDYLHLLINYPPKISLAKIVNSLKGVSSRKLKLYHPEVANRYYQSALWSPSYFAASCGGAPIEIIKAYVQQQRKTH